MAHADKISGLNRILNLQIFLNMHLLYLALSSKDSMLCVVRCHSRTLRTPSFLP